MPSLQLARYLQMRALGASIVDAAADSGIGLLEAGLTEKAIERGDLEMPDQPRENVMEDVKTSIRVGDGPEVPIDLKKGIDDPSNAEAKEQMEGLVRDALGIAELAADTLRGDMRDALLGWFKATPKPWAQLGENEQRDMAAAADRFAGSIIKQACQIIAAGERPCIVAQLVEYKEKDGVEAKLKLPSKGEVVQALHEACGREVLVVTSGAEEFLGEAAPAEIDGDQRELGIGDEYDEAA